MASPPSDSRAARAWVMAFQSGFKRTSAGLEDTGDDLVGLLELADLRLVTPPLDVSDEDDS